MTAAKAITTPTAEADPIKAWREMGLGAIMPHHHDAGHTYNAASETGGVMVGKEVTIEMTVEAASVPDTTEAGWGASC